MNELYSKEKQIGKRFKPKQKERNRIKEEDYNKAIEVWGSTCFCGSSQGLEMHHVVYRSQGGRGGWRNLILLCDSHHEKAHQDYEFRKHLEIIRKREVGNHFWCDKWDLWEMGLIEEPEERLMDEYFRKGKT